ncbi:HNH endonuclease [Cognatishimia sp.]|uniref:HNH endonuclease n=1 Tax=Cognatishimia sp. TaxID=2211648 RepID=UPI0035198F5D|nr:HNH endonuclease [Cognatishimia sp.]
MKLKQPFTVEELKRFFEYDPIKGQLFWKPRGDKSFDAQYGGKPAFTCASNGYLEGALLGEKMKAHRVIWAINHGYWPTTEIDHINHVRSDNRISNLREVSHRENSINRGFNKSNTSGHSGICWCKTQSKWKVQLTVFGKKKTVGRFQDLPEAISARNAAYAMAGYHKNHGKNLSKHSD